MTAIAYADFRERFEDFVNREYWRLSRDQKDWIIAAAWEECAWVATLTDKRAKQALANAANLEETNS